MVCLFLRTFWQARSAMEDNYILKALYMHAANWSVHKYNKITSPRLSKLGLGTQESITASI